MKGDKLDKQAGSGSQEQPTKEIRETSLEDKAAAAAKGSPGKSWRGQAWERWQRQNDHPAMSTIVNPVIEK